MNPETFDTEIRAALSQYDRHVVALRLTADEAAEKIVRLMDKAIMEYERLLPEQKHALALDRNITVILSRSDSERPLCAIYFNLHTPYLK